MGGDSVPELLDQINAVPPTAIEIDLLVISSGGDGTVAWQVMSLLRERFQKVSVLVPQAAYSAATLLALGADEIVMHHNGNLGPVDPQMLVKRWRPGSEKPIDVHFGYEDLMGFLEFVKEEVGITDQIHVKSLFEQFCNEVGPVPIGTAARGSLLSITMGEKLLRMHMTKDGEDTKARGIAETLNKKFFHHGYPVSRKEAREIGLKVAEASQPVEAVMWRIWLDLEEELEVRRPFDPTIIALNGPAAAALTAPVPQVNLPVNLPPAVLQQVVNQVLAQLAAPGGGLVGELPAADFRVIYVVCESLRHASRCILEGKVFAARQPDLDFKISMVPVQRGWIKVDIPDEKN